MKVVRRSRKRGVALKGRHGGTMAYRWEENERPF
jgi:hypothetical protein